MYFNEKKCFKIIVLTFFGNVFLFGLNFVKSYMPALMIWLVSLVLLIISLLCSSIFLYLEVKKNRKINEFLVTAVKFFVICFFVFFNVIIFQAFSNGIKWWWQCAK
jgi:hypothetical protein